MCLVMTNPVDILAVRHVKQGIEAGGFRAGHPSTYYLLLSNPDITFILTKLPLELKSITTTNLIDQELG